MTDPIPTIGFEAKIVGLRKVSRKDGDWADIQLQLQPNDAMPVFLLPLGARLEVTVSVIGDDEQPVASPKKLKAREIKPKRAFHSLPRSQQAALKCQDHIFQEWRLGHSFPDDATNETAITVRDWCMVNSRAEFDTDEKAGQRWDALLAEFERDTGRVAEARG